MKTKSNKDHAENGRQNGNGGEEFFQLPRAEYLVEDIHSGRSRRIGDLAVNPLKVIEDRFTLQVSDDAMSGADIHAGDYVILEKQAEYTDNNIIAVKIGSKKLVRRCHKTAGRLYLQCDPPTKQLIIVDKSTPDFEVLGQVMQVIREIK